MIFNKVNRHKLSVRFPWSAVTCSSAGSHGSSQLRFSVFAFMCSSSVFAYLSSSRCWVFLCFSTCGSHQAVTLGAATQRLNKLSACSCVHQLQAAVVFFPEQCAFGVSSGSSFFFFFSVSLGAVHLNGRQ